MTIEAAIFDLDGTLVDSQGVAAEAFREAHRICVGEGDPPVAWFHSLSGHPFESILSTLGLPASMAPHFRRLSRERIHELALFPRMGDVLTRLELEGVRLGLITGKDRQRTIEPRRTTDPTNPHDGRAALAQRVVSVDTVPHFSRIRSRRVSPQYRHPRPGRT